MKAKNKSEISGYPLPMNKVCFERLCKLQKIELKKLHYGVLWDRNMKTKQSIDVHNCRECISCQSRSLDPKHLCSELEYYKVHIDTYHRLLTSVHGGEIAGSFLSFLYLLQSLQPNKKLHTQHTCPCP